jgi:hypothetical protein
VEEIEFFRLLHNGRKEVIEMTAVALKHCWNWIFIYLVLPHP